MNSSTYDNVITQGGCLAVCEGIELVISDIVKIIETKEPVYYCPFCILSFADSITLEGHLRSGHLSFLNELQTRSINLNKCPLCSAKFFSHHLIARHAITYHSYVIFEAFFKKVNGKVSCLFCNIVLDKGSMTQHVGSHHTIDFNEWFIEKFCAKPGGVAGLIEIPVIKPRGSNMEVEDLNEQLRYLNVWSGEKPRSILKSSDRAQRSKLPVRRELCFGGNSKENVDPKVLKPPKKPNQQCFSSPRIHRRGSVYSWNSALKKYSFQCGKCSICFSSHTQLVLHVKKEHRKLSLNIFQPFYQCALCGAKFYKSSYLKKHNIIHSSQELTTTHQSRGCC